MKRGRTVLAALPLFLLSGCAQESTSIGIIGGADGPVQVMVAVGRGWWVLPAAIAVAAAVGLIVWMKRRKKG